MSYCSESSQISFNEAMELLERDDIDESMVQNTGSELQEEHSQTSSSLTVAYDMGWQKRSSGRKYDSLSGVGAVVG